jgi:Dihydroorotase and related cyclic amidohydrolases
MNLIYQGVVDGKLSLARWVETCSTTPARLFGMYPRKGVIAPGSDADIVVYDPNGHSSLGLAAQHMNMDYSAWEGSRSTARWTRSCRAGRSSCRTVRSGGGPATAGSSGAGCPTCCTRSGGSTVDFGVVLQATPPAARVIELARQAELHGFRAVWTFDSHLLWEEPYVIHSQILARPGR